MLVRHSREPLHKYRRSLIGVGIGIGIGIDHDLGGEILRKKIDTDSDPGELACAEVP